MLKKSNKSEAYSRQIQKMFAKCSPNFAKCSSNVRQMFAKCRQMFVKIRQMFAKCLQHFARNLLFVDRFRLKFKNSFGREMGRRRSILRGTAAVLHRFSARCFLEGSRGLENSTVFMGPGPGPGSRVPGPNGPRVPKGPCKGPKIQMFGPRVPRAHARGPNPKSQMHMLTFLVIYSIYLY